MKRFLPDTLPAWTIMILLGCLAVTQASTLLFVLANSEKDQQMAELFRATDRISAITTTFVQTPVNQQQRLARSLSNSSLMVAVQSSPALHVAKPDDEFVSQLHAALNERLSGTDISEVRVGNLPMPVAAKRASTLVEPGEHAGDVAQSFFEIAQHLAHYDTYTASIRLRDGRWLNLYVPISPLARVPDITTLILAGLVVALVLGISLWSIKGLTTPYSKLGAAAEHIGRDLNTPPLAEAGPLEARLAARALNAMQERLKRMVADREQLAAAIAHDIRTPVTRLRLRTEAMEDPMNRLSMIKDLDEIETITQSILSFARDNLAEVSREKFDLVSLVQVLCDDTPGVEFEPDTLLPRRLAFLGDPVGLRRCLANLLDNAIKYGHRAHVTITLKSEAVVVCVIDEGPGIPEAETERVFRPFLRLPEATNREVGGTGLGLTIARSIARRHDGEVRLSNHPGRGLAAELILPIPNGKHGTSS